MLDTQFKNMFDILPFGVYVIDTNTMDILYINQLLKNKLQTPITKCYETIYSQSAKCQFCKIDLLNQSCNNMTYELFNDYDDRWYQITQKTIEAFGNNIAYSIAVDISNNKDTQKELSEAHAMLLLKKKELAILNNTLEEKVKQEVSIRLQKEQEIIQKDKLLQESKISAMTEMINMLSHQWRQPLSAIVMNADAIKIKHSLDRLTSDDIAKHINNITRVAQELASVIDDFSNLFNQDTNKQLVKLDEILQKSIELNKEWIQNSNISLELNINTSNQYNISYNDAIQVLLNIIKNSIEALEIVQKDNKYIKINLFDTSNCTQIDIIDNGVGIPNDDLTKIFEPYYSTKSCNKKGLGLYFANILAKEQLNANIIVENKNDTKFSIQFFHN